MNRARINHVMAVWLSASFSALLLIFATSLMPALAPVFAQEVEPTPTSASTAEDSNLCTAPCLSPTDITNLVIPILQATIALWLILFIYTGFVNVSWLRNAKYLAARGISVEPSSIDVSAFIKGQNVTEANWKIKGPNRLIVGGTGDYTAYDPTTNKAITADAPAWSVDPKGAAVVNPEIGANVKVTAMMPGEFKLIAAKNGGGEEATLKVAVVDPQGLKVSLPVFARGYGSIAVAVVLLAVVLILGLSSILTSDAIATFVGGLLGYIFGRSTSELPPGSSGGEANGP